MSEDTKRGETPLQEVEDSPARTSGTPPTEPEKKPGLSTYVQPSSGGDAGCGGDIRYRRGW